jgi:Lhr-like helicase
MSAYKFELKRKVLALLGAQVYVHDGEGKLIGFCQQKAFKLKEDIRVFTDEKKTRERFKILARQILDFSAAYDVIDCDTGEKIGALKRKGWSSLFRDAWVVMDENDVEVGKIEEDSVWMAFVRRIDAIGWLFPPSYTLKDASGTKLATFKRNLAFIQQNLAVTVEEECELSPYFVLAAGLLLMIIEGQGNH